MATLFNSQQPCFWLFKVHHFSMQICSQTELQPDAPHHCPPPGHTPQPHAPWLHSHVAAPPCTFMAMLPPPSSCMATLPPLLQLCAQLHSHSTASLTAVHVAAPLPPTQAMSQHASQWDALCCCPHRSRIAPLTATQHHCMPYSCMGRIGTSLLAVPATLPPPLQLGMPHHCMPHSWTGHIGASLAAAQAIRHLPCSCTCHVTVRLIAGWAMLLPPLQLHHGVTSCCRHCCVAATIMPCGHCGTM
jgi:hypothetical protein